MQDMQLKKYDKVVTANENVIGELLRIHHRQDGINPELRLYASYLEVWSVELGGHSYIPTDYIDEHDAAARKIYLSVPLETVQKETWDREPDFIASHLSRKEELPTEGTESII